MSYRDDHATNPCTKCGAAPGVICEHDEGDITTTAPQPPPVYLTDEERAALRRCRLQGPRHEREVARAAIDRLIGGGK